MERDRHAGRTLDGELPYAALRKHRASALVAVIPVVTLPDYKTIARGIRRETERATNHESPPSGEQPDEVTAQKSFEATARHRAALTDATRIMLYVSSMFVNEEVLKMLEKESAA